MMNYRFFGGLFYLQYAYVDLCINDSYVADSPFYRRRIPVRFGRVMVKDNEKYRIVLCKVRRKYREEFEKALGEISNKMSLLGHNDYDEFCAGMMQEPAAGS